jgi:hypothetical protein
MGPATGIDPPRLKRRETITGKSSELQFAKS